MVFDVTDGTTDFPTKLHQPYLPAFEELVQCIDFVFFPTDHWLLHAFLLEVLHKFKYL
jgi:hypothetical protein